ncbi:MAG TPA: hypothetical protein VKE74_31275, partial [Gemmataceae bacterium]|nr:hypothetical protein [Gemmataceae bacterium]
MATDNHYQLPDASGQHGSGQHGSGQHAALQTKSPGEEGVDAAAGLSPAKLLHALRRRWILAIPLGLLAGIAAGWGGSTRVTPLYTARTLLQIPAERPVILYSELGSRQDSSNYQRTQIATVKSRLVGQSALRELQPLNLAIVRAQSNPVGWLEQELQADFTVSPEIMKISLKGTDPDELLVVLNAIRDAYVREVVNRDRNDRIAWRKQLTELAAKDEAALNAQRQQLSVRAEALGASDFATLRLKYQYAMARIDTLKAEYTYYRSGLERASLETVNPSADPTPDPLAVEAATAQALAADTSASGLWKDVARLEFTVADYRQRLTNYAQDPDYQQKTEELKTARAALDVRRQELRVIATEQVRAATRDQQLQQAVNRTQVLAAVKQYLPELETEIRNREQEASKLSKGLAELELFRGQLAQEEERLKLVTSRIQAIEVELQAPPRARLLEEAVIVETPRWDRQLKFIAAPAVGAFLLVVLLIAWLDARAGRVDGIDDLAANRIRVIGTVPAVQGNVLSTFTPPELAGERRA